MKKAIVLVLCLLGCLAASGSLANAANQPAQAAIPRFARLGSSDGYLAPPTASLEQTSTILLDVDKDGITDVAIGSRRSPGPSMSWYRRSGKAWTRYLIEPDVLSIEPGGVAGDVDGDGDLDIINGGDYQSNKVWWWENPYPNFDPATRWVRREVKNWGPNKHHDLAWGDFDGDGQPELAFWNQYVNTTDSLRHLYVAEIPANPKTAASWPYTSIYSWASYEKEGLAGADIDGDGKLDLVGGGRWFKHTGGSTYAENVIDDGYRLGRVAVGQLKPGGRPEVLFVIGDGVSKLRMYEWNGSAWTSSYLGDFTLDVDHGHSLEIGDINNDGHPDVFIAEMRLQGANPDSGMWALLGDGAGGFTQVSIGSGYDNHESKLADLDGDGDLDIVAKPFDFASPGLDLWINQTVPNLPLALDQWQRHVVDAERPWRSLFLQAADVNGDRLRDILTGGWWYQNPGSPGGTWLRRAFGEPLQNLAVSFDFDLDGDLDVLGAGPTGANPGAAVNLAWGRNDGAGNFTILTNLQPATGTFLQGAVVNLFQPGELSVALSWHQSSAGIQKVTMPANPVSQTWTTTTLSPTSLNEDLSAGDIDRDGDLDLLLGPVWLRNDGTSFTPITLNPTAGEPDRARLADVNGDGKRDAVLGFETVNTPGKLAWYEQGAAADGTWSEHTIADPAIIAPMSLSVVDMDRDGDVDVIAGEHNTANPSAAALYIFENLDGTGISWARHTVYIGDEHHMGAQVADVDGDGDLDILSIGWENPALTLYENLAPIPTQGPGPTPVPGQHRTLLPLVVKIVP